MTTSRTGLLSLLVVCAAAGIACGSPAQREAPAKAAPAPAPTVTEITSPVSINAEMVRLVDHAAHQLWNVERKGMAPKTDADWEAVEEHATQVAAAGALIRLEGTGVNDRMLVGQPDWQKWAIAVSDAGLAASKAAEARNLPGVIAANGQLVEACEGCHKRFKPALPSEGINHSHLR